jgi:NAD(P)-dependent dehydrogenase (short-subunit alcohol dehydrogenase family)
MGWLDGKVALVTGGGSGIGRGIVARFVQEGARVGVLERVPARVEELTRDYGKGVVAITGDVSRLQDNKRAVEQTVGAFGRLDVFVGNAGIFDQRIRLADLPEDTLGDAFDEQFGVNVKGLLLGAKAAMPELLKTEGCMVFTASVAGFNSGGGGVLYTASKHAVVGVIRQLAMELAPTIRVNGVAPGGVITDLRGLAALGQSERSHWAVADMEQRLAGVPLGIRIQPEDIAAACLFLASKENSRAITGEIIQVDAGGSLRMPPE